MGRGVREKAASHSDHFTLGARPNAAMDRSVGDFRDCPQIRRKAKSVFAGNLSQVFELIARRFPVYAIKV